MRLMRPPVKGKKPVTKPLPKKKSPAVRAKKARPESKPIVSKPDILYRGEKRMADTKSGTTTETAASEAPDPRLVSLVVNLVPASPGETPPTEEQKKLALDLQKLVEGAQKKAEDKAKGGDKGAVDEAVGRFFSGDVASAAAQKVADEQKKKDEAQQKAAQAAAGQPVPAHSR
jgi:hypothetical protein